MSLFNKRPKASNGKDPITKEYRATRTAFMLNYASAVTVLCQNPLLVRIKTFNSVIWIVSFV